MDEVERRTRRKRKVQEELFHVSQILAVFFRLPVVQATKAADQATVYIYTTLSDDFNPLSPGVKFQILLLCFHTCLTEVVGRSC